MKALGLVDRVLSDAEYTLENCQEDLLSLAEEQLYETIELFNEHKKELS